MKSRFGVLAGWLVALCLSFSTHAGVVTGSGALVTGDVDWYGFSNTASGNVSISTSYAGGTDYDTVLFLFRNDGSLDTSDFIAYDDDSGGGLNSLISGLLDAGDYLVAVATHGAWYSPLPISGGHHVDTQYALNISGDFVVAAASDVPEPGSLALLGLGLVGLAASRKRKQA
jgi:hypothetical protein